MAKTKPIEKPKEQPKRARYYRIVECQLKDGDTYPGYQPEIIEIEGDKVVKRELVEKPNLFEYAQTIMMDMMDPRNNVAPATDFV